LSIWSKLNIRRQSVSTATKVDAGVLARNIIYYIAGVIIVLLMLRIVLLLLAANQDNGFVNFIYAVSGFFAWPFYGIFSYRPVYGQSTFEISSLVGIVAAGLAKLFTLTKSDETA
jgi:hypothetical protein